MDMDAQVRRARAIHSASMREAGAMLPFTTTFAPPGSGGAGGGKAAGSARPGTAGSDRPGTAGSGRPRWGDARTCLGFRVHGSRFRV
jgi:hypothetical protein